MQWYDERQSQPRYLCSFAFTFARIAEQTVFARITDRTTPKQFELALRNLQELCARFERQMDWSHYPSRQGAAHSCIRDVLADAEYRLKNLAIMQEQQPPPARQQLITREGVVIDLEETPRTSRTDTDLGIEDRSFDTWDEE